MFERFTDDARRTLVYAGEQCRSRKNPCIEPGHIVLGILQHAGLEVPLILGGVGLTFPLAVATLRDAYPVRTSGIYLDGQVPFSDASKAVLNGALLQALEWQHVFIGLQHLLVAAYAHGDPPAQNLLRPYLHDLDGAKRLMAGV